MPADFSKASIYNKENGFSTVLFGADGRVTELELNEAQEIQRNKLKDLIRKQVGNGVYSDTTFTYTGGTLTVAGGYAVVDGEMIPISSLTLAIAEGQTAYLDVYESVVTYSDTIKRYGNQQETITETNNLYDTRVGAETTRRVQIKHNLVKTNGVSGHIYLTLGTITSGAFVKSVTVFKTNAEILSAVNGAITSSDVVTVATANKILKLDSNAKLPASITGNSATSDKWSTARTLSLTSDVTGSGSIDGSGNVSIALTLASVGTAGTYTKVTTDAKGRVTSGTTLGASDIPSLTHDKISDFDTGVRTNTLNQMATPTADLSIGGFKLTNVATPVNGTDGVNKTYADNLRAGISLKDPVRVATTASLPANTYSNGVLTASANGALTVDGVAVALYDRILVKNEATGANNGLYYVSQLGTASVPYKLTRCADSDNSPNGEVVPGLAVWVDQGTDNGKSRWTLTTQGTITIGSTVLTFTKDLQSADLTADESTLTKSGNVFAMKSGIATAGTYKSVTVDTYGRVTAGTNPTTLAGYGITDATPSSHVGATGTSHGNATTSVAGFMSSADKTKLDGIATGADAVADSTTNGNILINGSETNVYTHPTSGVVAGTYKSLTVDANGHVTGGTNPTTLAGYGITDATPSSHVGATGTAHGAVTTSVNGFMIASDKTKLDGIEASANNYSHPTGDGNMHVPATSTTNNGKVLMSGATAGSASWQPLPTNVATASALQTSRAISLSGDATGTVNFNGSTDVTIAVTLANSGVVAGTYKSVTVDVKGRVTGGTNPTTLAGYGITDATPSSHVGATGSAHGVATQLVNGFMSTTDKTKLDGVATNANNYVLPTATDTVLGGVKSGGDVIINADATMSLVDNIKFLQARGVMFRG